MSDSTIQFLFKSPLFIREENTLTDRKRTVCEAVLLSEGLSKNNIQYTVQDSDFEQVAKSAEGKPVYFGTNILGKHDSPLLKTDSSISGEFYSGRKPIGIIHHAYFDRVSRKVKAILYIYDNVIRKQIRKGYGISIRGISQGLKQIISHGKRIFRAINLKIHDINLLKPSTKRGVEDAKITRIIEESMMFYNVDAKKLLSVIGVLASEGEL